VSTRLRGPVQDSLHTKSSGSRQNLPELGTPNLDMPSSSSQLFMDSSSSDYSTYSLPANDYDDDDDDDEDEDDDLPGVVPFTSAEIGINGMNREALQRYNMDGVAQVFLEEFRFNLLPTSLLIFKYIGLAFTLQVLLALERIEQDEELSYEVFNVDYVSSPVNLLFRFVNELLFSIYSDYWRWSPICSSVALTSMTSIET